MSAREFLKGRRAHVIFAGAFLSVLAFNFTAGLTSGLTVRDAVWKGISVVRPMEYLMFALFWYMCAVHRPKDGWNSSLTSLNLSQSNQK